jgi:hypothetical protein
MFKINDEARTLEILDTFGIGTVLCAFVDQEVLLDRKYTLYAYAEMVNDRLFIKFGEAKKQSIYARYHRGTATKANDRMVRVWESDEGDKKIHTKLAERSKNNRGYLPADKEILHTEESYEILSVQGLQNLLSDISEYAGPVSVSTKASRVDYPDVVALAAQVVDYYKEGKTRLILDLCTRYGKTGTFCLLFRMLNELRVRIHILASYVGTVKTSYSGEISTLKNNENCLFVDPDLYEETELAALMSDWLKDPKHYICYYLALTGDEDTCFARRISVLDQFKSTPKSIIVEEADFGAGCDKQIKKLKHLYNIKSNNVRLVIATTGTRAEKCESIIEPEIIIKRDYILDVLNKRPNAVGINWYCLNNNEMVKFFNYSSCEMENFSDMFTVSEGKLKGELWFLDFFNFLFNKQLPVTDRTARKYRNHNLLNDAATMVFTSISKEGQHALKVLLERILPGYLIKVINGDVTTNAEAEREARQTIKDYGTKVIFIASSMANRSFSIPEIKNIILLCNAGFPDQKIARGLTPWSLHPELKCNIIDTRLSYNTSNLVNYLSGLAVDSLEDTATHTSIDSLVDEITSSDKLAFFEYFAEGVDPIRKLTGDELSIQMQSRDYLASRAFKVLTVGLDGINMPRSDFDGLHEPFKFSSLTSTNIKGDAAKKSRGRSKSFKSGTDSKAASERDPRLNHLAYMLNHKDEFNSGKYETNILESEFRYNMSDKRKLALENAFGIDMNVICEIAELLIKNNIMIYN